MSSRGEYRVIMAGVIGWCVLGLASAVWPEVGQIVSTVATVLIIVAGVALVGGVVWLVWSEIAFDRELDRVAYWPLDELAEPAERVGVRS